MEYGMKFHHFFKWYLLIAGINNLVVNTLTWIISFFDVTILTVTISAKDIWIHVGFVVAVLIGMIGIRTSGKLRRMERDSVGWVNAWLGLFALSSVVDVVSGLIRQPYQPLGYYLGQVAILVLTWHVFKYYRNRREMFMKKEQA